MKRLVIIPLDFDEACAAVRRWHRHLTPPRGHKFSIGLYDQEEFKVVGAAIIGRPIARHENDGWTLEVLRVATDGSKNACSRLYGAARRAAFAMGWKRLITMTLTSESGASLRGAGFKCLGEAGGGSWNRVLRPRVDTHPTQIKIKWEARSA